MKMGKAKYIFKATSLQILDDILKLCDLLLLNIRPICLNGRLVGYFQPIGAAGLQTAEIRPITKLY
jgi:hypothetical protein